MQALLFSSKEILILFFRSILSKARKFLLHSSWKNYFQLQKKHFLNKISWAFHAASSNFLKLALHVTNGAHFFKRRIMYKLEKFPLHPSSYHYPRKIYLSFQSWRNTTRKNQSIFQSSNFLSLKIAYRKRVQSYNFSWEKGHKNVRRRKRFPNDQAKALAGGAEDIIKAPLPKSVLHERAFRTYVIPRRKVLEGWGGGYRVKQSATTNSDESRGGIYIKFMRDCSV